MDFEKAFDSIHRGSLSNILRSYGIPSKMVRVIAGVYEGFECVVIDGVKHQTGLRSSPV